jgi:hypothetical protein
VALHLGAIFKALTLPHRGLAEKAEPLRVVLLQSFAAVKRIQRLRLSRSAPWWSTQLHWLITGSMVRQGA